jgi:hypothetical protein
VRFKVPNAFVAECLQDVSQSFGSCKRTDNTEYIWFHLLSKDVKSDETTYRSDARSRGDHIGGLQGAVDNNARPLSADNPRPQAAEDFNKENFTWMKPGFVLKIEHVDGAANNSTESVATLTNGGHNFSSPTGDCSVNGSSKGIASLTTEIKAITLLCFGAPLPFKPRFKRLQTVPCGELLKDPFILLEAVFDEMHKLMDGVGWYVADVFGKIENVSADIALDDEALTYL